jgi:quercetin dioxygenase-like cupin family protein
MAIAMILDLPGVSAAQYATAREILGDTLLPGNLLHVAGPTEDGWRVMEVWESPEAMGAFFQSAAAGAAFQAAGIPPAQPTVFPVSTLVAAASPAAPQPVHADQSPTVVIQDADTTKEISMIQLETADLKINPSDETIRVGSLVIRFLVTGTDSSGGAAIFEMRVPAGEKVPAPAHSHDAYEETVYGLAGVLTWTVDGQRIAVGPGQALCIPRGAVHRFDNVDDRDARALVVITPAQIGPEYFREVAAVLDAAGGGPPDRARMADILRRHGLTPAS